jgi:transcriptional regulator with XRE-family HTH domain
MAKKAPSQVDIIVGLNIRFYRNAAQLSQTELGEKIGVSFQQVQKYEKGTNRVGASRLNQIAVALGVPVIRLFDGVSEDSAPKRDKRSPADLIGEPNAHRLATAFAEISSLGLRRSIVLLVEQLVAAKRK